MSQLDLVVDKLKKLIDSSSESRRLLDDNKMKPEFLSDADMNIRFMHQKSRDLLFNYGESLYAFKIFKKYENMTSNEDGPLTINRARILKIDKDRFEKSLDSKDSPENYLSSQQKQTVEDFKNYWIENKFDNHETLRNEHRKVIEQASKRTLQYR
jgi:hypothetical protein